MEFLKEDEKILIDALRNSASEHSNIKFAFFEALERIPSIKGFFYLMQGLSENDDLLLMAAIFSLNIRRTPWVTKKVMEIIQANASHRDRIICAIVASKAVNIFRSLVTEDEKNNARLLDGILKFKNPEVISEFLSKLKNTEGSMRTADAKGVSSRFTTENVRVKRVLAVDNSNLTLHSYRITASDLGLNIITTVNGSEAWKLLEQGEEFDLIITDMNMPVMDRIGFTGKVRFHPVYGKIPLLIVTTESKQTQSHSGLKTETNDFIKKPFTKKQLEEKINKFLYRQ